MLVWLLNAVFDILFWVLNIASWVLLIYVVMALVIPDNKYTQLIGKYVQPFLAPVRALIQRIFPKLGGGRVDFSPIGLWLIITVVEWLLRLLQRILL